MCTVATAAVCCCYCCCCAAAEINLVRAVAATAAVLMKLIEWRVIFNEMARHFEKKIGEQKIVQV